MTLRDRVESLKDQHALLDATLKAEVRKPQMAATAISEMKRKKLRIKDELERLTASL
ncbi:MAG TPA: DUF465 domain-containing protein [Magnetospirillaceae bacterium]|nr:DUF465 domain-containing protein [Magnetospirillaceae bacterium]